MKKSTRLVGIDLCRAIAAFAVILVHSGDETWGLPISDRAIQFRHLFYFAVPFFLAASFYFGIKKMPLVLDRTFWRKKFQRIVVPYLLWSIFYVISKTAVFLAINNTEQVRELLSDPIAIIFFGAASYHLYFIPLLLAGTILLYLANFLYTKSNSIWILLTFFVFSLIIYQLLIAFNINFALGSYTAFPNLLQLVSSDNILYQPVRILLVDLAWMIRCLPYFFLALLLKKISRHNELRWVYKKETVTLIFLVFVLLNLIGYRYLPAAICEISIAYCLLVFSVTISRYLPNSNLFTSLGLCSFGIYLIHPFVKSAIEIVLITLLPEITQTVSITSMLIYSSSSFLISWALISTINKNKTISQYI
jgi:peptidoglycan/LPS O-acetylase OafA/YrhL